ncbi:IclR family transcriptional regulator [Azospirillum sp. YIM DDC1]|uniref:IclR family transcriptional regulator n=1 Tax=Azospirillum aestuarii TaxID=2802052 RepID=A0ABS1I1G2_9PROT|nr:IclR family transcriptional regulator [Azospirillum aestuarii]MBK4720918.1 IclR family transcriptional regulator [Azospirillum aestuarii]TWA78289.1 IclR family transcriptional regulator [Azospirillum brasilense]
MAKSALRVLEIMEFVASSKSGSATHTEISQALGIPKSSLTGLLRDLQRPGYLQLDRETGRFSIGSQVMFLAHAYIKNLNIVRVGAPVVHQLFLDLNEYTTMAIPKGDNVVVVCSETLPSPLAHSLNIGEHLPMLTSALGRAILAFVDEGERETYLKHYKPVAHTEFTKTDIGDIRRELAAIRESGLAYVREEFRPGITGYAAPVFNINGRPIASIGVALPTARIAPEHETRICTLLLERTTALSKRLGAKLQASPAELFKEDEDDEVEDAEA